MEENMPFNIVLVEPEIPQNTGNIARTCAATGSILHMVKPLGFSVEDKYLKRAGLDYWSLLDIRYYENLEQFFEVNKQGKFYYSTTKAINTYADFEYTDGSYFLFGKETAGLPEELLLKNKENCIKIPMLNEARSLNLSNSVAIVIYEALRQSSFSGLKLDGKLTKYDW
jgi:tRNA (cytidine/uridine-2'-O-)-methyltransferase